ncbi:SNARE and/or Syntaxin domain containing protein [Asbolus verrucosus]|uniref:SNARE and/or Syntaxin domain containing protein n=1 Tax=Asbolus verrucosus TaxID=1661398 RepID=A0A482VUA6_ASBVE|nr:SNARE and/or Syntaxin domain containing protein [Asbolus verrucosus]
MTKDKLAALVAAQSDDEFDDAVFFDDTDPRMDDFYDEVETIRAMTTKIRTNIEQVKDKHDTILSTPYNDEKTKLQLEELMDEIDRTAHQVRAKLKQLKMHDEDDDETSAYSRIRTTQLFALSTAIVENMTEYNRIKLDYRDNCKARLQRQLEIAGKLTTDEELENMLEQGSLAIFTQDIIMETQQARQSVADIEARHADIIKLEKSIRELHDMFVDMAMLVESQGELLDRVEYHVQVATEHVKEGRTNLTKAEEWHIKARKKKIAILICLAIIIVILIVVLATFLS